MEAGGLGEEQLSMQLGSLSTAAIKQASQPLREARRDEPTHQPIGCPWFDQPPTVCRPCACALSKPLARCKLQCYMPLKV
jgi:hypothetical protein